MSDFIIITDSSCDLPADLAEELGLVVAPLTVLLEGREYRNLLDGSECSPQDFYAQLRQEKPAKTSAVNIQSFVELMEPLLQAGHDLLYIGFSTGLSATYSAGAAAMEQLAPAYPERKLYAVDSLCASLGQGLLIYLAAQQRQAGASIEQVRDYAEEQKYHLCHWFTVDDLQHLKRGGRVSATTAMLGTALSIKPVMHMDNEGHLTPVDKVRGRKASLKALATKMADLAIEPAAQTVFISHADCEEEAQFVADLVKEQLGVKEVLINYVGPVIGAHCGPGTIALFFLGRER